MPLTEALLYILLDTMMGMLVIPIQGSTAVAAIKVFGGYPVLYVIGAAVVGSSLATLLNWGIGWCCWKAFSLTPQTNNTRYPTLVRYALRYGHPLLLLLAIPLLGSLIAAISGALKFKLRMVVILALLSSAVYYSYILL